MKLSSADVADYLRQHPEFFDEYAQTLAEIYVPHPHGGRAIPISERQIVTLREKNRALENKLREFIKFGEENDVISEKMHRLAIALLAFSGLENLVHGLKYNLHEDFAVPHIALRLWDMKSTAAGLPELATTSADARSIAASLTQPYCGDHVTDEIKAWFGEAATGLASFAMIPLAVGQPIGLLVLASEEAQRFYPQMGTLYLQRLGDLASAAFARHGVKG